MMVVKGGMAVILGRRRGKLYLEGGMEHAFGDGVVESMYAFV